MRSSVLSVAVVGAGRWGALHAAKLHTLPDVRIAAIVDPDRTRAARLADRVGAVPHADLSTVHAVAAATIAVPHAALAQTAHTALRRGMHVLVEKPLALTVDDAQHLVSTAKSVGCMLKVGFLERFNTAVADWRPDDFLIARRVGPRPAADLTLDWLVHDLDLAHWLLGPHLRVQRAEVGVDGVRVALAGASGRARLTAQVGAPVRRRVRDARGCRNLVGAGDALGAQMRAFITSIEGPLDPRLADGVDAVRALERVAEIRQLTTR
ncbi:MAG: putative dehydrogenase [Bradymonadia bacterium]|jgi:predicted dehydrogenase